MNKLEPPRQYTTVVADTGDFPAGAVCTADAARLDRLIEGLQA